jgi:DnaA regulatory inactivator Hda
MSFAQQTFDFSFRPAMGGRDFVLSTANEVAVKWLDRWREWPMPFLIVTGEKGCGKTHLCHVWAEMTGAKSLDDPTLFNNDLADGIHDDEFYYIDGIEKWLQTPAEEGLFHLFNLLRSGGGRCVVTAQEPIGQWRIHLKDLASRLKACPTATIAPPDDMLLQALLQKTFRDRQVLVKHEVIQYLLPRIERRFESIPALVEQIDSAAMIAKKPVTVPLVKKVLEQEGSPNLL